jgi:diadenosine tetraphosphate (Ap4A) HIT family hydrolase
MATIHEIVEACQQGTSLLTVARMKSGWAVMGETQITPGYCLLLPDPVVGSLNDLRGDARSDFLKDMARLGDAILASTDAWRINYEILGNVEPVLHAHVIPRYDDEDEPIVRQPVWLHNWEKAPQFEVSVHGELRAQIIHHLKHLP